jgi:hypothetical protein
MRKSHIMTVIGLLFFLIIFPTAAAFAITLTSCTIEAVDSGAQRLTIQALTGETWTLSVANPDLIKGMNKGDRVSVELDPDERIVKIVKIGE